MQAGQNFSVQPLAFLPYFHLPSPISQFDFDAAGFPAHTPRLGQSRRGSRMNWFKSFWKRLTTPLPDMPPGPVRRGNGSAAGTPVEPIRDDLTTNFTPRAQQVLVLARKEAERLDHHCIGTEHLLLGLIALGQGCAVNVLQKMGIGLETIRAEAKIIVDAGPKRENLAGTPYSPRVKKVLGLAVREARALYHTYTGTEHILLGLLRERDGAAARILEKLGMNLEETRQAILAELNPNYKPAAGAPATASPTPPKSVPPIRVGFSDAPGEPVDTSRRYDIYCTDWSQGVTVYRKARFKGIRQLLQRTPHDLLSSYVELEQADGRTVFVSRSSIIRFAEPEEKPAPEGGTGGGGITG